MPLDFPNTPSNGSTYTADGVTWQYDGEKWIIIGSGTDPVAVSASPPTSPGPGDAWFDTDSGTLLVYYDGFWVAPSVNYSIGTAAVGTAQIADKAVTTAKLASGPTYETSLPTSPTDGQEIYYSSSATVSGTVVWHLRYRSAANGAGAGSGAWEFLGGSPLSDAVETYEGTVATHSTYQDLTTVGPSVTAPVAGTYLVTGFADTRRTTVGDFAAVTVKIGTALASDTNILIQNSTGQPDTDTGHKIITVSAASTVLKLQYRSFGAAQSNYQYRRMLVVPIRVWNT